MKITVDSDFPNPQPFVDIIHQVADRYMDRMLHKSIIAGKLATAEIHLHLRVPTEEDRELFRQRKDTILSMGDSVPRIIYESVMQETVEDTLQTDGFHQAQFARNCVFSQIDLFASPSCCLREFAEVVAHEMTHMLVCESHNFARTGVPMEGGTFPFGSSLQRWEPERNVTYGHRMEEIAVQTVGAWLVKDLPLPADRENEDRYCPELIQIGLCNLMANAFGTPLEEMEYLDAFSLPEDRPEFPNIFWYAFALNQFGCIISVFDALMGEGSYETLCGYIDSDDAQGYTQAIEMLRDFTGRYRTATEESEDDGTPQQ